MTDSTRSLLFGAAAISAEIAGWIVVIVGSYVALGLALILGGLLLWAGVPGATDTRPGTGFITLGLDSGRGQD